jgi:hypothetical protein
MTILKLVTYVELFFSSAGMRWVGDEVDGDEVGVPRIFDFFLAENANFFL